MWRGKDRIRAGSQEVSGITQARQNGGLGTLQTIAGLQLQCFSHHYPSLCSIQTCSEALCRAVFWRVHPAPVPQTLHHHPTTALHQLSLLHGPKHEGTLGPPRFPTDPPLHCELFPGPSGSRQLSPPQTACGLYHPHHLVLPLSHVTLAQLDCTFLAKDSLPLLPRP